MTLIHVTHGIAPRHSVFCVVLGFLPIGPFRRIETEPAGGSMGMPHGKQTCLHVGGRESGRLVAKSMHSHPKRVGHGHM